MNEAAQCIINYIPSLVSGTRKTGEDYMVTYQVYVPTYRRLLPSTVFIVAAEATIKLTLFATVNACTAPLTLAQYLVV